MIRQRLKVLQGTWFAGLLVGMALGLLPACHDPAAQQQAVEDRAARTVVAPAASDSAFAHLVERLSEPGGYFDTDNLISNETSYLHVLGALRARGLRGGAFIGVGPDQSFAYIAQIRPALAFMIDIRRDNLLQHLFFKTLFTSANNRIEYLCLLFGKPAPAAGARWQDADIQALVDYIDGAPAEAEAQAAARMLVLDRVRHMGLALSEENLATIGRIHDSFIGEGLALQFSSHGRAPQFYYPDYRDLLLEKDLTGQKADFLAREDDFQFIKTMQQEDRIVPVVGDLSGPHALAAIGHYLAEQGEHVSAFYTSNVEFYLMRGGRFDRFAENVKKLPYTGESVIIRSYFNRFSSSHPQSVPGYASTQLLQTIESLVEEHERGGYRSYWDLITKHSLGLR
jgi:hypothetical protein